MASTLTQLAQAKSAAQLQTMSAQSYKWLSQKVSDLRNPLAIAKNISSERERYASRFILGGMYFFYYDAKTKDDLPYYDKFPLVLVLERYPDSFLGLNLHYLPIKYRVVFLDKLMQYAIMNNADDPMRVRVTYDILSASRRLKEFRPCIKKYLYSHMRSKILTVMPNEWDVASFLPVHQFKGAKPQQVWQESIEQIRNS
jgi:hypothetical protein